jgi:DNA-damage-inducible protein J
MATMQISIDDETKSAADSLFISLGLDTSTAVRMFIMASIENNGLPFAVRRRNLSNDLAEAVEDTRLRKNLHGPYKTAEEAVASMLSDDDV